MTRELVLIIKTPTRYQDLNPGPLVSYIHTNLPFESLYLLTKRHKIHWVVLIVNIGTHNEKRLCFILCYDYNIEALKLNDTFYVHLDIQMFA
jgi:hypothetical protein